MKFTKKQIGITSAVVLVLAGGVATAGIVSHNNAVQAKQVQEQKAKDAKVKAEKEAQATAKKAIEIAQKAPTDKNIQSATDLVAKVNDQKVKDELTKKIEGVKARVKAENAAKSAVSAFQKDNGNSNKQKTAQNAVNALTSSYSKALKADLQNKINASVKAHSDAEAKAKADQEAQAKKEVDVQSQSQAIQQVQTNDSTAQVSDSSQVNDPNYTASVQDSSTYAIQPQAGSTVQASAPNYTTPAVQTPEQATPSNNSGGKAPASWQSGTDADSLAKQEEAAQNAGTGNAVNKQPGAKW
ncbi:hypothetical protein [Lactococcus lactis]|uniref:Membrane protein involved in colicin uptake n=1 Tax=Lactococcus lactis TaxID=1358 RepID=A0AAW5TRL1_9LACT|nr:hypothetical protein [Lactococcus lactis]MCW2280209.1 membrane protein involved in colicin uptake [Lactococcus lactis]